MIEFLVRCTVYIGHKKQMKKKKSASFRQTHKTNKKMLGRPSTSDICFFFRNSIRYVKKKKDMQGDATKTLIHETAKHLKLWIRRISSSAFGKYLRHTCDEATLSGCVHNIYTSHRIAYEIIKREQQTFQTKYFDHWPHNHTQPQPPTLCDNEELINIYVFVPSVLYSLCVCRSIIWHVEGKKLEFRHIRLTRRDGFHTHAAHKRPAHMGKICKFVWWN